MPRSKGNWDAFFKRSDAKNAARRKKRGEKIKERKPTSLLSTLGRVVLPRVIGDAPMLAHSYNRSHILENAERRRENPTAAEAELQRILDSLNGGVLRGKFRREHVISGKWIVDFFFPEIRLAIEVDGSIHDTQVQRAKDREKEVDCKRFDITLLRLRNAEIFGDRDRLIEKLRAGWRAAKGRESRIVGVSAYDSPRQIADTRPPSFRCRSGTT